MLDSQDLSLVPSLPVFQTTEHLCLVRFFLQTNLENFSHILEKDECRNKTRSVDFSDKNFQLIT